MANNLKKFNTYADYSGATLVKPAVSLIADTNDVYFDQVEPTPPPTFSGKWLAIYADSTASSAECDSTSAITQNEIALNNLVSVEIGDCVTSIGYTAFFRCGSLTSCTIGSGVTSIGPQAFFGCTGLTGIAVNASVPPTLEVGVFNDTNDCPIYVPAASVSAYQSEWSRYASRIKANSEWTTVNTGEVPPSTSKIRIADNVTLQEGHNATFGTVPVDTWALQYDNGTWYNFRLFENGSFVANHYQLTSQDGYYIIDFGSVQPFLSCDADSMGQGAVDYATFSFDVYND